MAVTSAASLDFQPLDTIFEILKRIEINSLDICKAVSKTWNKLIYDPCFFSNYYGKNDNVFGYLLQTPRGLVHKQRFVSINESDKKFTFSRREFEINSNDVKIVGSSLVGILCCVRRSGGEYRIFVCKPTTKQWQSLPNPKWRYFSRGVGFAVVGLKPLHFVIIRISDSSKGFSTKRCEIFDSKRWSWKELDELILPSETFLLDRPAVHAKGHISWLTTDGEVISFTTDGATRRTLPMPEAARDVNCHHRRIIEYEGKLGYVITTEDHMHMELWVMENWESGFWRRIQAVDLHALPAQLPPCCWTTDSFCNSGLAFLLTAYRAMFYGIENSACKEVRVLDFDSVEHVFPFRSDFDPVNLKGI